MDALRVARELVGVRESDSGTELVGFNKQIRPILSDKCLACHGPDEKKRKAGLRLDEEESAKAEGRSGNRAIVPGDREASELWYRVSTHDEADRMPPSGQVKQLTQDEIELLGKWIDQGAKYQKHWAFVKPERPEVPKVANTAWPKNPIDSFVLSNLEKKGIEPSPEADKEILLRRVYLDLIGIPPTPTEIEAFLTDDSPNAYEKVVDELLASPHYGERWARHWLDAARYADSNGYSIDGPREIWKYRDWVIDAFNRDMPFDQFTIEQLAGDLLPDATRDQRIATGFHRNSMANNETGIIDEEYRVEGVADRVDTTANVWLGMTLGCAQCHDHKYDPVSQREYYQLFAYFNNSVEPGLVTSDSPPPTLEVPTDEQTEELQRRQASLSEAERAFGEESKGLEGELERWKGGALGTLAMPPVEEGVIAYDFDQENPS
ncbi:MAG: DUF1549 domain-containing protein, partial [Candidatus Omnitrophica bacterium]|nr:DUF1549 domain-containing protein [Candidatus Omnitrophota bacterium]